MTKFDENPRYIDRRYLQEIDENSLDNIAQLVEDLQKQYPNVRLSLAIDSGYNNARIELYGSWKETPEEIEVRRQEWEAHLKVLEAQKAKDKKDREAYELKEYKRLHKKYGAKAT